jgi:hypothetical protein
MNNRSEKYHATHGNRAYQDYSQHNGPAGNRFESSRCRARPPRPKDFPDELATENAPHSEQRTTRTSRGSQSAGLEPKDKSSQPFSTGHRPYNHTRPPDIRNGKPTQELTLPVISSQNVRSQYGTPRRSHTLVYYSMSSLLTEDTVSRLTRHIQGKSTMNLTNLVHTLAKTSVHSCQHFMSLLKSRDTSLSTNLRPEKLEMKARDTLFSTNLRPEEVEMICWYANLHRHLLVSTIHSMVDETLRSIEQYTGERRNKHNISETKFLPIGNGQDRPRQHATTACQHSEITSSPRPVNNSGEDFDVEQGASVH